MLFFGEPVLMLFGASGDTIKYAADYMKIYCLGTLFTQLTLGLNSFITAQGKTLISMCNVAAGAVTNIILDAVFIDGLEMGVKGAALATVISQGVSACLVIRYLTTSKSQLRIRFRNIRFNGKLLLPCVLLGISPALMQLTENMVAVSFNTSLQKYGGDIAVASMSILNSVMQFVMLLLPGLVQGAQPLLSYNLGAGNISRVKKTFNLLRQRFFSHLACLHGFSYNDFVYFYKRYCIDRLHGQEYARISGNAFDLWNSGSVPVQFCGFRSGVKGDFSYYMAKDHYTYTARIYTAAFCVRACNWRLYGRADC